MKPNYKRMTELLAYAAREHYNRSPEQAIFVCGVLDPHQRRWTKLNVDKEGKEELKKVLSEPIPNISQKFIQRWIFNRLHRTEHRLEWWDKRAA